MAVLHAAQVDQLEVSVGFARRGPVDQFSVDALRFVFNQVRQDHRSQFQLVLLRIEQLFHPLAQSRPVLVFDVVVGREFEQCVRSALAVDVDAFNQAVGGVLAALGLGADFGLSDLHACHLYSRLALDWDAF